MSMFCNHGDDSDEPAGTHAFVQWKGTDVCMDFYCDCGEQSHFDGYFAYVVTCPACGQEWEMPCFLTPRKRSSLTYEGHIAKLMEGYVDPCSPKRSYRLA